MTGCDEGEKEEGEGKDNGALAQSLGSGFGHSQRLWSTASQLREEEEGYCNDGEEEKIGGEEEHDWFLNSKDVVAVFGCGVLHGGLDIVLATASQATKEIILARVGQHKKIPEIPGGIKIPAYGLEGT